ncbi:ATP-binding cassette domain-containing protein [Rubritalea tangerina]|uniref:ATP-binding cassette domain-containing protein n=1 Tax=Rubritalea tangerina TaxID=430798 RepID=A0ABW4Z6C2_9BACT
MDSTCSILIPSNVKIGYGRSVIAEVAEGIKLGEGTHYLLARNGRGKTTLLRSLARVLKLQAGEFTVSGRVQFVPEDIEYNSHLPARVILGSLVERERLEECYRFADRIELDLKKPYRSLSTGNKRKISWLMAEFSCDPDSGDVLLLDEPFTGVDSYVREAFMEYWESCDSGVCRLVSCHPDFDSMSIRSAVLISEGRITAMDSSEGYRWGDLKGGLL